MSDFTDRMFEPCACPISSVEGVVDGSSSCNVFGSDGRRSSRYGAASKNTISERRRRRRLNERLYRLRAIVPVITKMDKASIIEDAIDYIQQLQNQVKVAEEDVVRLRENYTPPSEKKTTTECSQKENIKELLEFDVSEVKENVYSIFLYCKCSPRVVLEVNRVIESMEMSVTYANFNSFDGYILTNIIAQKEDAEKLQVETLKRIITEVIME